MQAKIFNNSPFLKIKEKVDDNSYIDKGLLVNYYHCSNNEKKTVWKKTKYSCPALNINDDLYAKLKGNWEANGTQIKYIVSMEDGKPIYADDYSKPYNLTFDKQGNYKIVTSENIFTGKYDFNGYNLTLFAEKNLIKDKCVLETEQKLTCEFYAESFLKKS